MINSVSIFKADSGLYLKSQNLTAYIYGEMLLLYHFVVFFIEMSLSLDIALTRM